MMGYTPSPVYPVLSSFFPFKDEQGKCVGIPVFFLWGRVEPLTQPFLRVFIQVAEIDVETDAIVCLFHVLPLHPSIIARRAGLSQGYAST
jgi:hypothetical protein